ncbi:DUF6873 family GME fold protein [Lutibacter sp.]|uniref:DUF6873 family GME fold protein n=1 Tax=Lutibacter sp. TaxID=1925666 RepID=UPI00356463DF
MYAIIDQRSPEVVKNNLAKYVDDVFEFSSENITYNSISGHPDIFMFQDSKKLIIAPNSPKNLMDFLNKKKVNYTLGIKDVGESLEESSIYNCYSTKDYFFCNHGKPDKSIQNYCANKQLIHVPQSYVRCSMFSMNSQKFITSDLGIVKVLENNKMDYFYFDPKAINIVDHKYGFIGGTIGEMEDKLFFLGNILKHKDGSRLRDYITANQKQVICLGNDYLYDGGGLFFVE